MSNDNTYPSTEKRIFTYSLAAQLAVGGGMWEIGAEMLRAIQSQLTNQVFRGMSASWRISASVDALW